MENKPDMPHASGCSIARVFGSLIFEASLLARWVDGIKQWGVLTKGNPTWLDSTPETCTTHKDSVEMNF